MSVNKNDSGTLTTLANGSRVWVGTKTAHDSAVSAGTMPNNCMVCITDDYGTDDVELTEYTPELSGDAGTVHARGCYYLKKNGVVEFGCAIAGWNGTEDRQIVTLPAGCRPNRIIRCVGGGNTYLASARITIATNGVVTIHRNQSSDEGVVDVGCVGNVTFIAAN